MVFCHHWRGYLDIFQQCLFCLLLVYALIIEAGAIVVTGCQELGFYNFCLYSTAIEDCQCITHLRDLTLAKGINAYGLVLAIIFTYMSLVFVFMGIVTMIFAQRFDENILWKCSLVLNVLSLSGLSLGMFMYVLIIWDLFEISHVTLGFMAILITIGGLAILCFTLWLKVKTRKSEVKTSCSSSLAHL